MMSDIDPLLEDFARVSPDGFARTLALATLDEADEVLAGLPAAEAAAVVCRMPAARIGQLLSQDTERSKSWLEAASFEDAVALLAQVPQDRCRDLVNGLQHRKRRRRLQQHLNYPSHSVGALVDEPAVLLSEDAPIADALPALRETNQMQEQPAIVVDHLGRYLGVLDLWHLATRELQDGKVRDYLEVLEPMRPELSIVDAAGLPQWASRNWLPVTDHEQHVVGWVSRARLLSHAQRDETSAHIARESLLDVISQMVRVMSDLLARLLTPGKSR